MKKISAYEIALSAVSCAIAAIALTVGTLYTPLLFTGYLFAGFALMIPLAKNCWWGDVLAFIGASLIALMFNGFNFFDTLPFIMFFGLHPLVNAVWFDASMYFVWRVVTGMAAPFGWEWVSRYIIPILLIGGTAFFFLYDYMIFKCQVSVNQIIGRIIRK